jgi:predicted dehydrogenase
MGERHARLGVVGLGMAGSRHAESVANDLANAELAAIVDPRYAIAQEFSERLGAPRVEYSALLLDETCYDCYTEILGQDGAIRVGYGSRTTDVISIVDERACIGYPRDFRKRFGIGFVGELKHFAGSILTQTAPEVQARDALAAYAIAEAASESLRSQRPVRVAEISTQTSQVRV